MMTHCFQTKTSSLQGVQEFHLCPEMNAMEKMADLAKEHHDRQSWQIWRYFANFVTAVHLLQLTPLGG